MNNAVGWFVVMSLVLVQASIASSNQSGTNSSKIRRETENSIRYQIAASESKSESKGKKGTIDPDQPGGPQHEMNATVVSKEETLIKVKTLEGEKILRVGSKTKGVENAKEGSNVTIKYSVKAGELRASEINPR